MNKFHEVLTEQLSRESNFINDNGDLKKFIIIDAAYNINTRLIELLIEVDEIKNKFFTEIKGHWVFDINLFVQYMENKNFLKDSYTRYKNKIGLNINGKFLNQRNEVSLVWPFKDCVLEGGQTKEDQKRPEIFFNELLAQEEIDQLFEPKVLTNWKRYTTDGEEKVKEIKRNKYGVITENLIIKGNNLLALHSLKKEFTGKVKLIYLDPPYNTGGDGFNYNDSFTHSSWLTFIKNRLEIAKELLIDGGLIFVQIDSSRNSKNGRIGSPELPYLHIIMDDLFGRKNYIGHLHWKKKKQPSFLSKIAGIMESILIYSNNESNVDKLQLGTTSDSTTRVDNADNKYSIQILKSGIRFMGLTDTVIKKGAYKNKTMTTEFLDDVVIKDGRVSNQIRVKAKFRTSQKEITKFCDLDLIYITERNSLRRFKTDEEKAKGKTITDLLLDWGQNQDATNELRKLFNVTDDSKPFDTPKPELLLHNLIQCSTSENDIILDFFSGSGTTQAVSHKLQRQYIGIEQLDYINTILVERLKKVIGINKKPKGELLEKIIYDEGGISKAVNWQGGGDFVYCELKKYNQTFIEQIEEAKDSKKLLKIWEEMKEHSFINYNVDIKKQDDEIEDFKELTLQQQKDILLQILNKNQLYVNLSSIDDEDFKVSDEDKKLTKEFYDIKAEENSEQLKAEI